MGKYWRQLLETQLFRKWKRRRQGKSKEVWDACMSGNLEFVSQCIANDEDIGQNVDWEELMWKVYEWKHIDIVHCIRDSGRVSLDTQLYYSCLLGDLEFVSLCITKKRDSQQTVDWNRLTLTAYLEKHMNIVRYIRNSKRVSLDTQLHYSFLLGDFEFVSQRLAEERDRKHNVGRRRQITKPYTGMRVLSGSERLSLDKQLYYSCRLGDLEFVVQCALDRYIGHDVDWESLMQVAFVDPYIVHHRKYRYGMSVEAQYRIGVSIETRVYYSIVLRELTEHRDRGYKMEWKRHKMEWKRQIKSARYILSRPIVRCIRDSGRVSLNTQLHYSCLLGDVEFVSQVIGQSRDRGENVHWAELMKAACYSLSRPIVRCIRDSRRVSLHTQLHYSCHMLGDLEFVSQVIAQSRDKGENINWKHMLLTAYKKKHMDIVRCIRDSGRLSLDNQLYYSCRMLRDLEFVSRVISQDRDVGENVDWSEIMQIAFDCNLDMAKVIVRSGRWTMASFYSGNERFRSYMYSFYWTEDWHFMFVLVHTEDVNKEIRPKLNTMHVVCYGHSKNMIHAALIKGGNVRQKGYMGRTALHFLCHGKNTDVDNILRGKPEQQRTKKSILSAGGSVGSDLLGVIDKVIKTGGDVNANDDSGHTPLHLLCLSLDEHVKVTDNLHNDLEHIGSVWIGKLLLVRGANINKRDNEGRTPLAVAAQHGNGSLVTFLCENGCDKNMGNYIYGQTPLYLSAVANNIRSAEILCEKGVHVNQPDAYNVTPLAAACVNDNFQIVDLLLQHEADPSITDMEERTALHKAAKYGSTESCKRLMEANVNCNVQDITGCTPLHLGSTENRLQIIKLLLDVGCDVNIENNLGNIALHNAVSLSDEKSNTADILLQNGADIDHKNNFGHTPIMMSAKAYNFAMIKFLHGNTANLLSVNNMGRGLIHEVVKSYQLHHKLKICQDIIGWLIENGLNINASDVNEQTPLHLAAQHGDLELVTFLVDSMSDVTARDKFNHMPLMNALKHPEVFQYLWRRTLPNITDDDFGKIRRLIHWFDIDGKVKKKVKHHFHRVFKLSNKPQDLRKLKLTYDDDRLEKWLNTDIEELPEFMANWLPSLQPLTYYVDHPTINKIMWKFLKDLQNNVKKEDPLVAYEITPCGSVEEKTKAFTQNEYDCSCVLENIRFEMFETPTKADHATWTAFVHLVCREEYCDYLKRVLDGKKRLSQAKLCHHFGKAIGKVLANPEFWAKYPQLQRISAYDISAGDRRICTMHVIWSDKIYPWLKIDIDLAPVINLSKWKPSWCIKHALLDEIECIALPKWKMTPKVNMDLMEVGVHSWSPLFKNMPTEMKEGYRLAKVVRDDAVCPHIPEFKDIGNRKEYVEWSCAKEFMNTYLLKQVIIREYTDWYDQKVKGLDPAVHTDIYWARQIYKKMEEAFKKQTLFSWFIPTYNLLNDDKFVQFQEIAIKYARLCQRLLTEEAADHFRKAYLGCHKP